MTASLQLDLARTMDAFEVVEPALDDHFAATGLDGRPAFVTRLVVEEAVRNVIDHGTGCAEVFRLVVDVAEAWVEVTVLDDCDPFDPGDAPPLDIDAPLEVRGFRGMGVHLMRRMSDSMHHDRVDGLNRLVVGIDRNRESP